jgi:hypothetical protein
MATSEYSRLFIYHNYLSTHFTLVTHAPSQAKWKWKTEADAEAEAEAAVYYVRQRVLLAQESREALMHRYGGKDKSQDLIQ